jgi:hypothetical protein
MLWLVFSLAAAVWIFTALLADRRAERRSRCPSPLAQARVYHYRRGRR